MNDRLLNAPGIQPASINAYGDPTKDPREDAYNDLLSIWLPLCPWCTRLGTGECLMLHEEVSTIFAQKNYHARNIGADGSRIFPTACRIIDNSRVRMSKIGVVMRQ